MYEPDYADYSLAQLHDCLDHIDRDNYPERYKELQKEIDLRYEQGETLVDPEVNELLAVDIPVSLGLLAWWFFLWRMTIAAGICILFVYGLAKVNGILQIFSSNMMSGIDIVVTILFITIAGIVIMMQVFAKRYPGYRIRIVKIHQRAKTSHSRKTRM